MTYCEDYPCCGHTPSDPCEHQPYDEPGYYDLTRNPHALCEHEVGICDVWPDEDDEEEDDEPFVMEDQYLDSYMEDRLTTMFE